MRVRVPPPASVEPLISFAAELERRDAAAAEALAAVERLQSEVEELRAHAAAVAAHLEALPGRLDEFVRAAAIAEQRVAAARDALLEAAEEEREPAEAALAAALKDSERAREHVDALERDGAARRADADRLCERARALGAGAGSLDALLAWASHERGALLVEHSGLARERETIVREASELLGSVLGDPFAATSVAGLRERLERADP